MPVLASVGGTGAAVEQRPEMDQRQDPAPYHGHAAHRRLPGRDHEHGAGVEHLDHLVQGQPDEPVPGAHQQVARALSQVSSSLPHDRAILASSSPTRAATAPIGST